MVKRLNLKIKTKNPVEDTDKKVMAPEELAIKWISIMIERALNKPDPRTGQPTVFSGMDAQRKYFKVIGALEAHKDGIVELEDDDFSFLDRKFHQAELLVQRDISEVLVAIEDEINKAKVEVKK